MICIVTRVSDLQHDGFTSSTGRMRKRHKWLDRKRGPNGKWIYDYGNGFPGEKRKRKFRNLSTDGNANEFVRFGGHKVYRSEDGEAFIRSKGYNPYKRYTYGKTAGEAARKYNSELQKRQHSIKMPDGRRYVY